MQTPQFHNRFSKAAYDTGSGVLNSSPVIVAGAVDPLAAVGVAGVEAQADAYGRYSQDGVPPGKAFLAATGQGVVQGLANWVPDAAMGERGAGEAFTNYIARKAMLNGATNAGQMNLSDAIDTSVSSDPDRWRQYMDGRVGKTRDAFLSTLPDTLMSTGKDEVSEVLNKRREAAKVAQELARRMQRVPGSVRPPRLNRRKPLPRAKILRTDDS